MNGCYSVKFKNIHALEDYCDNLALEGKKCIPLPKQSSDGRLHYPCDLDIKKIHDLFDGKKCKRENVFENDTTFNSEEDEVCWVTELWFMGSSVFQVYDEKGKSKSDVYCPSSDGIKCDVLEIKVEADTVYVPLMGSGYSYYYDLNKNTIKYVGRYIR